MTISQIATKNQSVVSNNIQAENRLKYAQWRADVSDLLFNNGFESESERWDYCESSPRYIINRNETTLPLGTEAVWVCSASHDHQAVLFKSSCTFRICPDCAPRQTSRLVARYFPVIEKLMETHVRYRLRKITLTRSIELGDKGFAQSAQDGFDLIQKTMSEVVGPDWKADGRGLLANWEVGEDGHKLHYHLIYYGPWVDWKKLRDAWNEQTGGDYVVFVQAVKKNESDWQGAILETLKYATKFYKTDKHTQEQTFLPPELTFELFKALKNTRRIRTYGCFYGIEEPEKTPFTCIQCEKPMLRIPAEHWQTWSLTGFSPIEWNAIIRDFLLQYKPANKSPPTNRKSTDGNLLTTQKMPFLDEIPIAGISHYEI